MKKMPRTLFHKPENFFKRTSKTKKQTKKKNTKNKTKKQFDIHYLEFSCQKLCPQNIRKRNPNKTVLFEVSFFRGLIEPSLHISRRTNLIAI